MELNHETVTGPARDAATVVMLRDGDDGLEVFLLKRHGLSDVLGGACVFPGGKLDRADAELDAAAHLDQSPAALHARLGEPGIDATAAASLYVAALREAFEESGVLFADAPGAGADSARAAALLREGHGFDEVLARMNLRLQTRSLAAVVALDHATACPRSPTSALTRGSSWPRCPPARPLSTTSAKPPRAPGCGRARRWSSTATGRSNWRRRRS